MWESEKKRQKLKLLLHLSIYLGHFEPVCFIPFWVIFFQDNPSRKPIQTEKIKTEICNDFFTRLQQLFFFNQMFLGQSNSYQMSCLRNFYQILMFLDQSDLIDVHFKFLEPVIY